MISTLGWGVFATLHSLVFNAVILIAIFFKAHHRAFSSLYSSICRRVYMGPLARRRVGESAWGFDGVA